MSQNDHKRHQMLRGKCIHVRRSSQRLRKYKYGIPSNWDINVNIEQFLRIYAQNFHKYETALFLKVKIKYVLKLNIKQFDGII